MRIISRPRSRLLRATFAIAAASAVFLSTAVLSPGSGAWAAATTAPDEPLSHSAATMASGLQPTTPHAVSKRSATVAVYAAGGGVLTPGQNLNATIVITNTGSDLLGAGTVSLNLTNAAFTRRAGLNAWLQRSGDAPAAHGLGASSTSALVPGSSTTVSLAIPAASIGVDRSTTGVFGLSAELSIGTASVATGTSSVVWNTGSGYDQAGIAIAMPLTAPATANGLISAADLATYTSATGILSRELNGVVDHPNVAIAIDPMIIASIRVLGSSAPASAIAWLRQLEQAANDTFPLQYGDADVAGQVQAGLTELLQPISLEYAINPDNLKSASTIGEATNPANSSAPPGGSTSTPTPTSTPTSGPELPSLDQLLSWPYTLSGFAWPPDDSVRSEDLPVFAKNGLTTTILDGGNTNADTLPTTPNAILPVSGGRALVADDAVSDALRAATTAATNDAWSEAMAALNAQLAMIGGEKNSDQVIFATLGRSGPNSWPTMSQTFTALTSMPWVTPVSITDAIASPTTTGLAVKDSPENDARIASITGLIGRESGTTADGASLTGFSTVLTDPTLLTGPSRSQLLSLLGVTWLNAQNDWPSAVSTSLTASGKILDSVQIVPPGKVSQLSNEVLIPITVSNSFTLPVNIVLRTTPSNGRLEIDDDTSKVVPPLASAKLLVPVKARVGNGKVQLTMELYSPTGVKIGVTQKATVDVHADWEGLGALIIGLLAVLLFGFGIFRSIRRRRRERAEVTGPPAGPPVAEPANPPVAEPAEAPTTGTHPSASSGNDRPRSRNDRPRSGNDEPPHG